MPFGKILGIQCEDWERSKKPIGSWYMLVLREALLSSLKLLLQSRQLVDPEPYYRLEHVLPRSSQYLESKTNYFETSMRHIDQIT